VFDACGACKLWFQKSKLPQCGCKTTKQQLMHAIHAPPRLHTYTRPRPERPFVCLEHPPNLYLKHGKECDLTSKVARIERWSSASGASSELYKGKYLGRTVSISAYFTIFAWDFIIIQVVVKVIKDSPDPEGFDVIFYLFPTISSLMLCVSSRNFVERRQSGRTWIIPTLRFW
jgi:hypothetical protein